MKKKNEQWLRYSNRALSGLLVLLGFMSCDNGGAIRPSNMVCLLPNIG